MSSSEPSKWTTALGASADVNVIPATTPAGTGLASMASIFPAITQVPIDSGGIAPERADFNALFKMLGDQSYFLQQGGVYSYSASYAYRAGDLVLYSGALYACIAANGPNNAHAPTDTAYWRRLALMSDVPTVGNGTITVQASGTPVGSFTVNQGGNSTINIPEATDSAFGVVKTDDHGFDVGALQGWVRLRSGIQIVWGAGVDNSPITFLRAFNEVPAVSAICPCTTSGAFACVVARSSTGTTIRVWNAADNTWSTDGTFTYIAIATWR
jgi:hypothetical protein